MLQMNGTKKWYSIFTSGHPSLIHLPFTLFKPWYVCFVVTVEEHLKYSNMSVFVLKLLVSTVHMGAS
jgi:hypothetical protein